MKMKYTIQDEFLLMAAEAKQHLEQHKMSIVEVRVEKENMDLAKSTIRESIGEQLFKRINFFPRRDEE